MTRWDGVSIGNAAGDFCQRVGYIGLKHEDGFELKIMCWWIFSIQVVEAKGDNEMIQIRYIE